MSREIKVGDSVTERRTFTEADVHHFAEVSHDHNRIHLDEEFAAQSQFGRRIVHGMLVGSIFSALLGEQLPGHGAIYMGQTLKFKGPVFLDMEVIGKVEVASIRADKGIVTMTTTVEDTAGKTLVTGEAVLMVPWIKARAAG